MKPEDLRNHPKYKHRFDAADEAAGIEKYELDVVWAAAIMLELDKAGLVDGLLPRDGIFVLYGESGSGKTFITLDLVCHVAAGRPWRGMTVDQGVVVYIAAENPKSVERRVWAWRKRHGVQHLPVLVVRSSVDLLNGSADALVKLVEQVKARHGRIAAVVVDTLSRAMTGNENAPDDMGKFVNAVGRIGQAAEAHAIVVHHAGKDTARGARGHSSLRAASDGEGEVTVDAVTGIRTLRITKNRDGEDGQRFAFRLEPYELGRNATGRTVTTCVAIETEAAEPVTPVTRLTPNQRVTMDALHAVLCDRGREPPPAQDIPRGVKAVTVEEWLEAASRHLPMASTKQKNQAAKRAVEWLVGQKQRLVLCAGDWVWLAKGAGHAAGHTGHTASCDRDEAEPSRANGSGGHMGHTGHTAPDATHVTGHGTVGSHGHTGHTHTLVCDPCDHAHDRRPNGGEAAEEKAGGEAGWQDFEPPAVARDPGDESGQSPSPPNGQDEGGDFEAGGRT
jgi:KaiC/GvpD/RAD55 family RecA-like ATPase